MRQILKRIWHSTIHHTRKNSYFWFYLCGYVHSITPSVWLKFKRHIVLEGFDRLCQQEQEYIKNRVDYYCKFNSQIYLPEDALVLKNFTLRGRQSYDNEYVNSSYYFDAKEFVRYFPKQYRWVFVSGDVNTIRPVPSIVKSRPITLNSDNRNNILLNMDKVRHFTWVHDPIKWEDKRSIILFRGDARNKPHRLRFIEMWRNDPICDLRNTSSMSLFDHLYYRYIMALEGNDVASNLKWIMSSNSVAVMPRPKMETWFMEGKLIANYHYIEIADDYHDLKERILYYESHPDEVKAIVKHANEWVKQFWNDKREQLISLMVMEKYFALTNQAES